MVKCAGNRAAEFERPRGPEIDHQLVFDRLLDRQARGIGATKDAIDICGRASPLIYLVDSIGNEAAFSGMKSQMDRSQAAYGARPGQ
jgi:hypothetical protein